MLILVTVNPYTAHLFVSSKRGKALEGWKESALRILAELKQTR